MRRPGKSRLFLLALIALLPSFLKRPCYRLFFGYRIGRPVAVGWIHDPRVLDDAAILRANWEIEVAGERVPAEVRPS